MATDEETALAQALRDAVEARDHTQYDAADAIGTSQQTFGKWLHGVSLPSDQSLPGIAAYLELPVEDVRAMRGRPRGRKNAAERLTLTRRLEALEDRLDDLAVRVERLARRRA